MLSMQAGAYMGAPEAGDMDAAEQEVPQADCDCGA